MLILAKVALGLGVTVAAAGTYLFHEGVIRVDVDEQRDGGTHVHFWVPATVVSTGLHFVPQEKMQSTARDVRPYLPVLREISKELEKYPNAELVNVTNGEDHVRIAMNHGKIHIDAVSHEGGVVHVTVPARVLRDFAEQLEDHAPGV
jgi:hypothetical protein